MITKHTIAEKIFSYLNHSISLKELVAWCENVMMDGEVDDADNEVINDVVAKIGVADVNNFGMLWEDCEQMLNQLGYKLHFDLAKVA